MKELTPAAWWLQGVGLYVSTRTIRRHIAVLSLVACVGCLAAQPAEELYSTIEKMIRYETGIIREHIPEILIGIIDGESVYYLNYNFAEVDDRRSILPDDVFEAGSITKVMIAHLLLLLEQQGLLKLTDPVNDHLPEQYRNTGTSLTIRDLVTHHGGLPRIPSTLGEGQRTEGGPYAHYSVTSLLEWYRDTRFDQGRFLYSHAGYALLQQVIENVTGRTLHDAFVSYLGIPLGLLQSGICKKDITIAQGYDRALRPVPVWSSGVFDASEGLHSSMADLIRYLNMLTGNEEMLSLLDDYAVSTGTKDHDVTAGWFRYFPRKNIPVYTHTGHTSGHSAMIAFSPRTATGVVIFANSSAGTENLGYLVLSLVNHYWKRGQLRNVASTD